MGRTRLVHPQLFTHDALFDAEAQSGLPLRVAYIGLATVADREGRFLWRPRPLKLAVLPYDECDFAAVLQALAAKGFVRQYGDAGEYGDIPSFLTWQQPHRREAPSRIPPFPGEGQSKDSPRTGQGQSKDRSSRAVSVSVSVSDTVSVTVPEDGLFADAWAAYPKRPNNPKAAAKRAWDARIKAGVDPDTMIAGVRAYAAYVTAQRVEPKFVKMASTFFGPDEHYLTDYAVPVSEDPYEAARKRLEAEEAA